MQVVIVCHGTAQDADTLSAPTVFARHLSSLGYQRRHIEGAGTRGLWLSRLIEKITGSGIKNRVREGLIEWEASGQPDRVTLLGWSRGAVVAVALAAQLKRYGVVVDFLGLWDPVGSYGIPGNLFDPGCPTEIPINVANGHIVYATDERNIFYRNKSWPPHPAMTESWWAGQDHSIGSARQGMHGSMRKMAEEMDIEVPGSWPYYYSVPGKYHQGGWGYKRKVSGEIYL